MLVEVYSVGVDLSAANRDTPLSRPVNRALPGWRLPHWLELSGPAGGLKDFPARKLRLASPDRVIVLVDQGRGSHLPREPADAGPAYRHWTGSGVPEFDGRAIHQTESILETTKAWLLRP
jgi:hypothetical protein